MKRIELDRLSTDDLWSLHVEVTQMLEQQNPNRKTAVRRAFEAVESPSDRAPGLPYGIPEISQSGSTFRDVDRTWQTTALDVRAVALG